MSAALSLENITCTFLSREDRAQRYTAVRDTTLAVGEGEFVSVVGPTGCGKSTLLNVAAGLLQPSAGRVLVRGEPLSGLNRRAGYIFQADALMPWRNALENVVAGLEFRRVERRQAAQLPQPPPPAPPPGPQAPAGGGAVLGARRADAPADGERAPRPLVGGPEVGRLHHP